MTGWSWDPELGQARLLLQRPGPVGHQSLRMVCWLLRSVLEQSFDHLAWARGVELGTATGITRLVCLRSLYQDVAPELADEAEAAWTRLSQAVHHHAYELSPTLGEVEELARMVVGVVEFATRQKP
jgi:hypothetical protein